ncbi:hypothetical protein Adt_17863 [Abeliophyllum distichum]|uniref:BED-type domain-containing protein n=1 Tax=Abeliophyllum distichum TaxID=126358 RepID=A0ABD1THQ2_9LAMI
MAYNRSDDDFNSLNDISIPSDIIDEFRGSTNSIDLDDVQEDVDTHTTTGSNTKRKVTKQKTSCWQLFELVPTSKLIDRVPEHKAQCKHCKEKIVWQKEIDTIHLNRYFKKCQFEHGDLKSNQTQLQFGYSGSESSSNPNLNN